MIRTLFVTILVAAIAEQADLVFRDGGNSCTIFKTEGTRTVHSQCDFHSPNIDEQLNDLAERMTRVEAALPATASPTENPTHPPTETPTDTPTDTPTVEVVSWQGTCTALASCTVKGEVTTLAGSGSKAFADGTDCAASFNEPYNVAYSPDGSTVAVTDCKNSRVRLIKMATGGVTTLAGSAMGFADGTGSAASFNHPYGLDYSSDGSTLAVADRSNHRVRLINVATREVTTLAGDHLGFADGTGSAASFDMPTELAYSPDGSTIAVGDSNNNRVRLINVATREVTTLAGGHLGFADGTGSAASFNDPHGVSYSPDGSTLAVVDQGNNCVRLINVATREVTTLAGGSQGSADGTGSAASFFLPYGLDYSPDGSTLAVADLLNNRVRLINVATRAVTTLAGGSQGFADGTGSAASFQYPYGVAYSPDGSTLGVADRSNNRVREICTGI